MSPHWAPFGLIWAPSGSLLGPFGAPVLPFGLTLAPLWLQLGSFGALLAPLWALLAPFWWPCGSSWGPFSRFWFHFGFLGFILVTFGEILTFCNLFLLVCSLSVRTLSSLGPGAELLPLATEFAPGPGEARRRACWGFKASLDVGLILMHPNFGSQPGLQYLFFPWRESIWIPLTPLSDEKRLKFAPPLFRPFLICCSDRFLDGFLTTFGPFRGPFFNDFPPFSYPFFGHVFCLLVARNLTEKKSNCGSLNL